MSEGGREGVRKGVRKGVREGGTCEESEASKINLTCRKERHEN